MKILKQFAIIMSICLAGQLISSILPFPFPGSIIGMIILLILLVTKVIKLEHLQEVAGFILANMAFFFIPSGIGILEYLSVIQGQVVKILLVAILSLLITFAATSWTVTAILAIQKRVKKEEAV